MTFDQYYRETGKYKYFKSHEWLVKGASHSNRRSKGFGLNTEPPFELWLNAVPLFELVDRLRDYAGTRIVLTSVYRSPEYNRAIGGAPQSYHKKFMAADLIPLDTTPLALWHLAKSFRDLRNFKGGIGRYRTFIHLDVRGRNVDF